MKKLKPLIHLSILISTPSLFVFPQNHLPHVVSQGVNSSVNWWLCSQKQTTEWVRPTTYDEIIQMLDDLESGQLERRYPPEQLVYVNEYLATLAKEGILPDEFNEELILEKDVEDLMYGENSAFELTHYLANSNEYIIIPAVLNDSSSYNIFQCGKISKAWKKTKKFVKKHKKEIIIGAVVVVAVTVVAVAVVATSSASAASAAAGAAVGAGAGSTDSGHSESKKSEAKEESPSISDVRKETSPTIDTNETPMIKATIDEHITSFKEFLVEDKTAQQVASSKGWDEMSIGEKAKEVGSGFAHQAYDEIVDLVKVVPQLYEEVKELGSKFLPDSLTPPNNGDVGSPTENYGNMIAKGHEIIDNVFSTDQARLYTAKIRTNDPRNDFAIGLIPFPGVFSGGKFDPKKLSNAGKVVDRGGFTRAGRNLMKHGYREGSVFPKPLGNPAQVNAHGQKVLESILNHPEKQLFPAEFGRYGKVVDIYAPGLGGARYSANGEFIGFLET